MSSLKLIKVGSYGTGNIYKQGTSYIYIPNKISSNTKASIFYPGYGAFWGETSDISKLLASSLASSGGNQILIVESYSGNGEYSTDSNARQARINKNLGILNDICRKNNVNITNVSTMGSSMGDRYAIQNYLKLINSGKDKGYCFLMGINNEDGGALLSQSEYRKLAGKTIFAFEGTNLGYIKKLAAAGANVVYVKCANGSHDALTVNPVRSNLFKIMNGNISNFINDNNYTFYSYKNNKWTTMSDAEIRAIANKTTSNASAPVQIKKDIDKYTVTDINTLKTNLEDAYSTTIICQNDYVKSSMQDIMNAVKSSNAFSKIAEPSYASTTKIPSVFFEAYRQVSATELIIAETMYGDIANIVTCGDNYSTMDDNLEQEAVEINNTDTYTGGISSGSHNNTSSDTSPSVVTTNNSEETTNSEAPSLTQVTAPSSPSSNITPINNEVEPEVESEIIDEKAEIIPEEEIIDNNEIEPVEPTEADIPMEEEVMPNEEPVKEKDNTLLKILGGTALAGAAVGGAYGYKKYKEKQEEEEEYSDEEEEV